MRCPVIPYGDSEELLPQHALMGCNFSHQNSESPKMKIWGLKIKKIMDFGHFRPPYYPETALKGQTAIYVIDIIV